jgi:hypothetical protein
MITGSVFDNKTGRPLSAIVNAGYVKTSTDSNGCFKLDNLIPDSYRLEVTVNGYVPATLKVHIESGHVIRVEVGLIRQIIVL